MSRQVDVRRPFWSCARALAITSSRIYLDHNSGSPPRPEIVRKVTELAASALGNPSSVHGDGRKARRVIDEAREEVAGLIGAAPSEVVFTSGGTEANFLAWNRFSTRDTRILTTPIEHLSVVGAAERARKSGASVTLANADREGRLSLPAMTNAHFISIQMANNETGAIHDIDALTIQARPMGARVHSDAVQAIGKLPIDARRSGLDYLSLSGHKLSGLAGAGALWVRSGAPFEPLFPSGHQEKGRRPGTENLLGIAALGIASRICREEGPEEMGRLLKLRDLFEQECLDRIDGLTITVSTQARLPNTSHLMFEELDGESLLIALDLEGVSASTGAACSSGSLKPSHVLRSMGYSAAETHGSIRVSLGWNTTEEEIARVTEILPRLVRRVREESKRFSTKQGVAS